MGTYAFAYNPDGTLASETLPSALYGTGTVLTRSHDALARSTGYTLASTSLAAPMTVSYAFDAVGRLHTVTAGDTVFTYGFQNGSGRVEDTTMAIGGTDKLAVTKSYDSLGRLLSIATAAPPAAATATSSHAYTYNAAGQRVRATIETGEYWDYAYDALGQVIGGVKRATDGTALPGYTFGYVFDDIGNRTSTTENGAVSAYTANDLNQYTSRTVPGVAQVRGRAATGAVVSVTPPGGLPQPADRHGTHFHRNVPLDNTTGPIEANLAVTAVLPGQGPNGEDIVAEQIRAARVEGTPQAFTHDDDGNLLSDGHWTHTWNTENRLVSTTSATARLEFLYDHQGRRVEKRTYTGTPGNWTLAETRRFLYDGWNLIAEFTLSGATLSLHRSHLWGLDLSQSFQGAGGVGGLLRTTVFSSSPPGGGEGEGSYYPVYDGNGNIVRYLDDDGNDLAVLEYSPFGRPLQATGSAVAFLPHRFSTKFQDEQAGLHYYGYRYYGAELGRWLNRDPIGENGGPTAYVYVSNEALSRSDYLGLKEQESDGPNALTFKSSDEAVNGAFQYVGPWFFNDNISIWTETLPKRPVKKEFNEVNVRIYYSCKENKYMFGTPLFSPGSSCAILKLPPRSLDVGFVHIHLESTDPSGSDKSYATHTKMFFAMGRWMGNYKKPMVVEYENLGNRKTEKKNISLNFNKKEGDPKTPRPKILKRERTTPGNEKETGQGDLADKNAINVWIRDTKPWKLRTERDLKRCCDLLSQQ